MAIKYGWTTKHIIFLMLLNILGVFASRNYTNSTYCASSCASSIGACYGPNYNQCWACSTTLYLLAADSSGYCQTKAQNHIAFYELTNSGMDLSGYSTSKPTPRTCDQYTLSGQYVAGDFIQKTFTDIPRNHFQVVLRFGIGFMGTWNSSNKIVANVDGEQTPLAYSCHYDTQSLCSATDIDCIKIYEIVISHNSPNLTLQFTSSITQTNPAVTFWGVKDLTIGIRTCHSQCDTCFGPNAADCITCAAGFYLLGNLCVPECEYYAVQEKRICVDECPYGLYANKTSKKCLQCQMYCLICTSGSTCTVWSDSKPGLIWEQNKFFWILLIVIGFLIFLYLLWKIVIKKKLNGKIQDLSSLKKSILSQNGNSDEIQNQNKTKQQENIMHDSTTINNTSNVTKDARLEEPGLFLAQQLPSCQIVFEAEKTNHYVLQKKKRKLKPLKIEEQSSSNNSIPSVHIDGTFQNLQL